MRRSMTSIGCPISLLVALTGCELDGQIVLASRCFDTKTEDFVCCDEYTPRDHPACGGGADAGADADADADASSDGEVDASADDGGPPVVVCPWPCTSAGGGGFDPFPSYVWIGEESDPPPQPLDGFAWTSWVGVMFAEPGCPTCSCTAPTNPSDGCVLPKVWSVESTVCQDPSSPTVTSFDPPLDWSGSCTATNPISGGILCEGDPCVKSLVVQPPSIAPCIAEPAMPPEGQTLSPPGRRKVIEYVAGSYPGTCSSTRNCIEPAPTDYKMCFVARGLDATAPCPGGWTDRYTGWRDISDTRACTPCACGSPEGSSCIVRIKAYTDDACSSEAGSLLVSSDDAEKCVDLLVGSALGGKTAEVLAYQTGSCVPTTSEIVGEIVTDRAVTYCCMSDPEMPK